MVDFCGRGGALTQHRPRWMVLALIALVSGMPAACAPGGDAAWHEPGGARPARGMAGAASLPQQWRNDPPVRWQWQLTGTPDLSAEADVYMLDAFTTRAATIDQLRQRRRRTVCYFNAGMLEASRPDAVRFPADAVGEPAVARMVTSGAAGTGGAAGAGAAAGGGDDRRWLDIRRWDVLGPILTDRLELCRTKGFDAVAPDGMDGYAHHTGYPLATRDQLTFNRRLAAAARGLGLAIGLTNDVEQAGTLEPDFDFAVNEECFRLDRCDLLEPFIAAGKPVFHVEYVLDLSTFCEPARASGFASMRKRPTLDAWRAPCS